MKDFVRIVTFPLYKAYSITGMKFEPVILKKKKIVDRLNSKNLKNINITIHELSESMKSFIRTGSIGW